MTSSHSDLLQLEHSGLGKKFIIGDLHGHGSLFQSFINTITVKDEVWIVGDLFDRGPNPVLVFQILQAHPNVYAVRGNHEDMLLKAMAPDASGAEIYDCLLNGGGWILQDDATQYQLLEFIKVFDKNDPSDFTDLKKAFSKATKIPELPAIINYIKKLPYIIRVGNNDHNGFIVCHADMPFSDEELEKKFQQNHALSPDEIMHLTWARSSLMQSSQTYLPYFANHKRNDHSMIVYCGHNILSTTNRSVRLATNHINLDGGAFMSNHLIVMNHTDGKATLFSHIPPLPNNEPNLLQYAVLEINRYFKSMILKKLVYQMSQASICAQQAIEGGASLVTKDITGIHQTIIQSMNEIQAFITEWQEKRIGNTAALNQLLMSSCHHVSTLLNVKQNSSPTLHMSTDPLIGYLQKLLAALHSMQTLLATIRHIQNNVERFSTSFNP
ncbi:MAG TPA: metallophosphoesterase [Legionellaceae bacterium]|nr:metallophosphoesterase [Legionellaceae bacterium]